jgi:hypothetical protein
MSGELAAERLDRIFVEEEEEELARLAVERGWISPESLRSRPIRELIEPDRLEELSRSISREHFQRRIQAPEEARPHLSDPSRRLADYVLVAPLGSGGAAEVWKAWDLKLGRWVAIKRLLGGRFSPERLHREATAAAKLSHPNIVQVFHAGTEENRPYLVLQLVEGRSLASLRLPLRDAVAAVRAASMAVYHAHEKGVVHRDLKPDNLMMDDQGEVKVLDFGLAHLLEASRSLTATGTVLGTPAFMSPEQARGDPAGAEPPSDIYSLGATLYELTTGRPPFVGESMAEIVRKVIDDEPLRPRRLEPQIPRDVETVILKAMDKAPRRRYATAAELAEDLRRWQEGEPILARPAGLRRRGFRFLRRHPMATGLGLAALVSSIIFFPMWWAQGRRAEEAQRKAELSRETAVGVMRSASMGAVETILAARRKGDAVGPMNSFLEAFLQKRFREAVAHAPDLAEPHYLMGRILRARLSEEQAELHQRAALARDPSYGPALYESVVLLSRRYGRDRERLRRARINLDGESDFDESGHAGLQALKSEIDKIGRRLESAGTTESLRLSEASRLAARGISTCYLGDAGRARDLLLRALQLDPHLEEVYETLAEFASGNDEKEKWFSEGLKVDAGYSGFFIGRAGARLDRALDKRFAGQEEDGDLAAAEEDYARASELEDRHPETWVYRGMARVYRGTGARRRGENPLEHFDRAEEFLVKALQKSPKLALAWRWRGAAWNNRGLARKQRGDDPSGDYAHADEFFGRAIELEPDDATGWLWRGILRSNRSFDSLEGMTAAEKDLKEAIQRGAMEGWRTLGSLRYQRAEYLIKTGADPEEELRQSEADLTRALEVVSKRILWTVHKDRGALRLVRARWSSRSSFSVDDYLKADEDLARAAELNPKDADVWYVRSNTRIDLGRWPGRPGSDAASDLRIAIDALDRALEVRPGMANAWGNRGAARVCLYRRSAEKEMELLRSAESDLCKSLELNPRAADYWVWLGQARLEMAVLTGSKELFAQSKADHDRAIQVRPRYGRALMRRGQFQQARGRYLSSHGEPEAARAAYLEAIGDLEQARALDPSLASEVDPLLAGLKRDQ